jgi:hypothetical protein
MRSLVPSASFSSPKFINPTIKLHNQTAYPLYFCLYYSKIFTKISCLRMEREGEIDVLGPLQFSSSLGSITSGSGTEVCDWVKELVTPVIKKGYSRVVVVSLSKDLLLMDLSESSFHKNIPICYARIGVSTTLTGLLRDFWYTIGQQELKMAQNFIF